MSAESIPALMALFVCDFSCNHHDETAATVSVVADKVGKISIMGPTVT